MTRNSSWCVVVVFVAFLAAPVIYSAVCYQDLSRRYAVAERRPLAEFPGVPRTVAELNQWPQRFERFFKDHLGFRHALMSAHSYFSYRYLGRIPGDRFLLGKEGWFFKGKGDLQIDASGNAASEDELLALSRGAAFSAAQLDAWSRLLSARARAASERGSRLLFAIAPRKHALYSEFLPDALQAGQALDMRYQQLMMHLQGFEERFMVVDLLSTLRDVKESRLVQPYLYLKTDGHWNRLGAFFAYQAIARRIAAEYPNRKVPVLELSDFTLRMKRDWHHRGFASQIGFRVVEPYPVLEVETKSEFAAVLRSNLNRGERERLVAGNLPEQKVRAGKFSGTFSHIRGTENAPFQSVLLIGDSFIAKSAVFFSGIAKDFYFCKSRLNFCPEYFRLAKAGAVPQPELILHVVAPGFAFREVQSPKNPGGPPSPPG